MKVLIAASEMAPFTEAGEFSSAIQSTAEGLLARGHEVSVVLPYYRCVREQTAIKTKRTGVKFTVPVGNSRYACSIRELSKPGEVQVFFVERDELFDRSGLYGTPDGDYSDNAARFIYFSKCVVELARRMDPSPEILHAHNWQTAFVPVLAAEQRLPLRTVLSAHTLEYQGNFWSYDFGLTNLPGEYFSPRGLEYFGSMNLLKGGILAADRVVLPGPRFLSEAQSPGRGCGLDPILREHAGKLAGITNGMDSSSGEPSTDKTLPKKYTAGSGKAANLKSWLSRMEWTAGDLHLLCVTDAISDGGLLTLLASLDRIFETNARVAILGPIHAKETSAIEHACRKHSGRLAWLPDYDDPTLHLAFAGSDALLCPGPIAPDARVLLQALRYGVPPVSLACGGLHALAPTLPGGFSFPYYIDSPDALIDALRRVRSFHADPTAWMEMVDRAMAADHSWAAHAAALEGLYATLLPPTRQVRAA